MAGKRVSASDMLGQRRENQMTQVRVVETPQYHDDTTSSSPVTAAPQETYERITVYVRPDQRAWLGDLLDREVRDSSGKPIKSISVSDMIRLAIDRLQGDVQAERVQLLQELIVAANRDAETFAGRKNRGLPKR